MIGNVNKAKDKSAKEILEKGYDEKRIGFFINRDELNLPEEEKKRIVMERVNAWVKNR